MKLTSGSLSFLPSDHETWRMLYQRLNPDRARHAHPLFAQGLERLGILEDRIPSLVDVNARLELLTGFRAIFVKGLESAAEFYSELALRELPVGHFVRDRKDLGYTPEPDVFHDLYGHVPFLADPDYADFCGAYGKLVQEHLDDEAAVKRLERFFWFTIEFGLIESPEGRKIFGAGLLSSYSESHYSLSGKPEVRPFDVDEILDQDFRIDIIQPKLFVLKDVEQLYSSLSDVQFAV